MAGQKEHPNPSSYHNNVLLDAKPLAMIRNREICQDQERQHNLAHFPFCELGVTYTPQLRA